MRILVASPEPGKGSSQALRGLAPLYPTHCHTVRDFYKFQKDNDIVLSYGFPFHCLPTLMPHVWYCLEPQVYLMREKGGIKKMVSLASFPIEKLRVHALADTIVADKANAERFNNIFGVYPNIVPYGVDYTFWSQTPPPVDDEVFTIAQIGEIQQFKNQIESIEAFAAMKRRYSSRLWFIGIIRDQKYYAKMCTRAEELGVKFTHIHEMPREWLRDAYYPYIDCVLHPVKLQGGFLTPLEAACANRPVIVSNECSCSDIIRDHYLGLVNDDSYSEWLDLVSCIRPVPNREWIHTNLTWSKYCNGVEKVLEGSL